VVNGGPDNVKIEKYIGKRSEFKSKIENILEDF